MKSVGIRNGQLDGNTVAAPALVNIVDQGAQSAAAAGLGMVHLVDENDAGHVGFFSIFPNALGNRLNAVLGIHEHDGGLNRQQRGARLRG